MKNFKENSEETELNFPSSLLSTERAYVHKLAIEMGLQSKSRGKGQGRYLTVFKKESSTLCTRDAELDLSEESLRVAWSLLSRHPVSVKERVELLPSETRPSRQMMGRLGGGVAQVPIAPGTAASRHTDSRRGLPITVRRQEVLEAVAARQVVLVTGDTGSGKTTQVPQFLLEEATAAGQTVRLVCCQPRRLTAITVADRVAAERGEKVGGTVGYQIRLESCVSPKTVATFCTYGVLLRSLCSGDEMLATTTHVIIDEVHEREAFSDFLLTVLRDSLPRHRHLRLILMSATMDTQLFLNYFPGAAHISIEGRMFPVQEIFLETILLSTGYSSNKMNKMRNTSRAIQSTTTIEELTKSLARISAEDDVVIEEGDVLEEEVVLADFDQVLENCFLIGSEDHFQQLAGLLQGGDEGRVDYTHSVTGLTALMVSASRGWLELVDLCLQLGADPRRRLSNGWSAGECAQKQGHTGCSDLIREYQQAVEGAAPPVPVPAPVPALAPAPAPVITAEEKAVLDLYQATVDTDKVDPALVQHLVQHIHTSQGEGAILVFLPGYEDIGAVLDGLDSKELMPVVLHSQVPSGEHRKAFQLAPRGKRKVVLATNIAETGVTISDVVFVIDTGKVKMKSFDSLTNTTQLKSEWVSQTSAKQRAGRAGRCQPGQCYRLYSSTLHQAMAQFTTPEILRISLLSLCLQTKLLAPSNTPIADFLSRVPDPPSFLITRQAVQALKTMEALDAWEEVTPLGLHLLDISLEPCLGKVLLHAVLLKCLDPVLTVTCMLAYRSPFLLPVDPAGRKKADGSRRRLAADTASDHMAMLRAFQEWQAARAEGRERRWCQVNSVSASNMEMVVGMRNQVLAQLRASGFVRSRGSGDIRDINLNSENWGLVKACLAAGLYPNLARLDREAGVLRTARESKVKLVPGSVAGKPTDLGTEWFIFDEMSRVGRTALLRGVTPLSGIAIALFCGSGRCGLDGEPSGGNPYLEETSDSETEGAAAGGDWRQLSLDSWTVFHCRQEVHTYVTQMRNKWSGLWARRLATTTKQGRAQEEQDDSVVATLATLLQVEETALGLAQPPGVGQRPKLIPVDLATGQPMSTGSRAAEPGETARFFVVKPSGGSLAALEAAMRSQTGVWSFPGATERKLLEAVGGQGPVLVIFSVQSSGAVQGSAVFTGQAHTQAGRTGVLMAEWRPARQKLGDSQGLLGRVLSARDGQELDPATGLAIMAGLGFGTGARHSGQRRLDRGTREERRNY